MCNLNVYINIKILRFLHKRRSTLSFNTLEMAYLLALEVGARLGEFW